MTLQIALVLFLLVAAIFLFAWEKFSVDVVTIFLLIVLTAAGIITPVEAFEGFGSEFVVLLASIYIISGALQQTGVLDYFGSRIVTAARMQKQWVVFYIMLLVGTTSAFMNNTTTTAVYLTPVMSVARKIKMSPSKILMPLAFASILGGTCTLIGTSTNIAVNGYLGKTGIGHFGLFDIFPIGIILFITGLIYMLTIGKKLLPDRHAEEMTDEVALRKYVSEIVILANSPLIGENIFQSSLSSMGFRVLNVIRDTKNFIPDADTVIHPGDILLVDGMMENLLKVKEITGIDIRADVLIGKDLQTGNIKLAEILVTGNSAFVNTTVKKFNFRQKYNLVVMAINRAGQTLSEKIGSTEMKAGDILLVQGTAEKINFLKQSRDIFVLEDFMPMLYKARKGKIALVVFAAAVIAGTTGLLPLSVAFLSAAMLIILFGIISAEKAYRQIDWRLLILIGGMSAFGTALVKTGAAQMLADNIISACSGLGNTGLLAGFIILTVLLTQPMSNAAAALVILPVALQAAAQQHLNPMTFAAGVMLAASVSLITPFEPSCILIYNPGRYRFKDFLINGGILTVLLITIITILVPLFWHF